MTPTLRSYTGFDAAYAFFNKTLFDDELPPCLITMQRHRKAYGFFAGKRFALGEKEIIDEIALNPSHFARGPLETFSTLVHEMAHLWQAHFGKPSRNGYHNKEWAEKMHEVGLVPSDNGEPGGKETGQKVSHYIADNGAYSSAFKAFVKTREGKQATALYIEVWSDEEAQRKAKQKASSKTKFSCPDCGQNAWAKADAMLSCGVCEEVMEAAS